MIPEYVRFVSRFPAGDTEINQDHPHENKQRLFIQSLQKSQPLSVPFGKKGLKGREVESVMVEKKGSSWCVILEVVCPGCWRLGAPG